MFNRGPTIISQEKTESRGGFMQEATRMMIEANREFLDPRKLEMPDGSGKTLDEVIGECDEVKKIIEIKKKLAELEANPPAHLRFGGLDFFVKNYTDSINQAQDELTRFIARKVSFFPAFRTKYMFSFDISNPRTFINTGGNCISLAATLIQALTNNSHCPISVDNTAILVSGYHVSVAIARSRHEGSIVVDYQDSGGFENVDIAPSDMTVEEIRATKNNPLTREKLFPFVEELADNRFKANPYEAEEGIATAQLIHFALVYSRLN